MGKGNPNGTLLEFHNDNKSKLAVIVRICIFSWETQTGFFFTGYTCFTQFYWVLFTGNSDGVRTYFLYSITLPIRYHTLFFNQIHIHTERLDPLQDN